MSTPAPHGHNPFADRTPVGTVPTPIPGQGHNPFAGGGDGSAAPATPSFANCYAGNTPSVVCAVCGSFPAAEANFREHRGMVVALSNRKLEGPFCRDCGLAVFREAQHSNLLKGWWSVGSLLLNPAILIWNAVQSRKVAKLPAPQPGGPRTPLVPGKPVRKRPSFALAVLFPLVLGTLIAAVVLTGDDDITDAKAGQCVRNSGTASDRVWTSCRAPATAASSSSPSG